MLWFSVSEARAWCGNDNPLRGTLGQPMVTSGTLEAARAPVVARPMAGPSTTSEVHNMIRHNMHNMHMRTHNIPIYHLAAAQDLLW